MTTIKVQLCFNPMHTELPLYFESAGQHSRAYLYLNVRDGQLWVGPEAHWADSMSQSEFDGDIKSFRIPNNLTETGYNDLMTDELVQGMCVEIIAGNERVEELLREFCDEQRFDECWFESLNTCGAGQYLELVSFSDCVKLGESIADAIPRLIKEALNKGFFLGERELKRELEYKRRVEAEED